MDCPDRHPHYIREDLSINDQESLLEFFLEKIFGLKNTIAEYDDNDADDHKKEKKSKIDLVGQPFIEPSNSADNDKPRTKGLTSFSNQLSPGYYHLDTPPPETLLFFI